MRNIKNALWFFGIIFAITFLFQTFAMKLDHDGSVIKTLLFVPSELTIGFKTWDLSLLAKSAFNSVTYIFLHGNGAHFLGNMVGLFPATLGVICFTGIRKGMVFYVLTGMFAALAHYLYDINSATPVIGASGAVFGMMGMFAIFRVKGMFSPVAEPIATLVSVYFLIKAVTELLMILAVTFAGRETSIAHMAHLGGFISGVFLGYMFFELHYKAWSKRL